MGEGETLSDLEEEVAAHREELKGLKEAVIIFIILFIIFCFIVSGVFACNFFLSFM